MQTEIPGVLIHQPTRARRRSRPVRRDLPRVGDAGGVCAVQPLALGRGRAARPPLPPHQADLWYLVSGRAQVGLADLRRARPHAAGRDARCSTPRCRPASTSRSGVAHGYLALTEIDLIYWVTSEYDPADENGVAWDDPTLALDVAGHRAAGRERPRRRQPAAVMGSDPLVFVTGADGQVGRALRDHLPGARFLTRSELDVTDERAVHAALAGAELVHALRGA